MGYRLRIMFLVLFDKNLRYSKRKERSDFMNCPYCESDNTIYHDTCIDTDTYWCNECHEYFDVYQEENN